MSPTSASHPDFIVENFVWLGDGVNEGRGMNPHELVTAKDSHFELTQWEIQLADLEQRELFL